MSIVDVISKNVNITGRRNDRNSSLRIAVRFSKTKSPEELTVYLRGGNQLSCLPKFCEATNLGIIDDQEFAEESLLEPAHP
jgi:hypothetical protein